MKKLTVVAFSLFILSASAQNSNINFESGTFAELKEKAIKENKLIFIDGYTTWCSPCKWMVLNVFNNETVADYYNKNFVNAKFDMEKGEGIELAKKYQVGCYPSLLFIDGKGEIQHRTAGGLKAKELIAAGEIAKDPKQNFYFIKANYQANLKNPDAIKKYIRVATSACLDPIKEVNEYFSIQKEESLTSEENWNMISEFTNDIDSREFKYLTANKKKYMLLYSEIAVNTKINNVCQSSLYKIINEKKIDEVKYNMVKVKVKSLNPVDINKILFLADLRLAEKKSDWTGYSKLALDNVDAYLKEPEILQHIVWNFYSHVKDKASLLKAEEWAKILTELRMSYEYLNVYANLLYKNGKKELAMEAANNAISFAKSYAKSYNIPVQDYKSTTELIEKINAMK